MGCSLSMIQRVGDEVRYRETSIKVVATKMLAKSLQARDDVFARTFNVVYLALCRFLLGENGACGRKLEKMALLEVGVGVLTKKVVEVDDVFIVADTISVSVHGPGYKHLRLD